MSGEQVGVNQVIVGLLESATNQIKLATDGAMDEQLYYRPTTNANSMAWLVWHLSRWQDHIAHPSAAMLRSGTPTGGLSSSPYRLVSQTRPPGGATRLNRLPPFGSNVPRCSGIWKQRIRWQGSASRGSRPSNWSSRFPGGPPRRQLTHAQHGGHSSPCATTRFSTLDRSTTFAGSSPNQ